MRFGGSLRRNGKGPIWSRHLRLWSQSVKVQATPIPSLKVAPTNNSNLQQARHGDQHSSFSAPLKHIDDFRELPISTISPLWYIIFYVIHVSFNHSQTPSANTRALTSRSLQLHIGHDNNALE